MLGDEEQTPTLGHFPDTTKMMPLTLFIAIAGASQGFGGKDTCGETWLAYAYPPVHIDREAWGYCPVCGKYKSIVFRGYRTVKEAIDLSGKVYPHISGGARFCPRCGKPLTPNARAELEKRLRG